MWQSNIDALKARTTPSSHPVMKLKPTRKIAFLPVTGRAGRRSLGLEVPVGTEVGRGLFELADATQRMRRMDRATPEGRKELAGLVDGVLIKPVVTGASEVCGVEPPQ